MEDQSKLNDREEAPPFLGTWKRVYTYTLILHFLILCSLYFFFNQYA